MQAARIQNNDFGRARVLVIGLDSATFDVIDPLFAAGKCPNLARIKQDGVCAALQSTIPPLSPAAWVTTLTGCNPGQHGVFDFRKLDLNKVHGRSNNLVHSDEYAGGTIFDYLSQQGLRVGAFNIPLTYPAWKINGVMVSGPITPDLRRAYTYPSGLSERLGPMGHHATPDELKGFDTEAYFRELTWSTHQHFEYGKKLLVEEGPFDLFWFHLHTLDSGQHRFWEDSAPENIYQLYEMADERIGDMLQLLGPESQLILLSDHGARARPAMIMRPNVWLQQQGWQIPMYDQGLKRVVNAFLRRLQRNTPSYDLEDSPRWAQNKAYAFPLADPVGGVVINLQGRQPQGNVSKADYETVRNQIIAGLQAWQTLKGLPIVQRVNKREAVYHGSYVDNAPDIIFEVDPDYMIDGTLDGQAVGPSAPLQPRDWKGVHAMQGVFFAKGPQVNIDCQLTDLQLADITPTLLYALQLAVPENMDGRIRKELFVTSYQNANQPAEADALPLGNKYQSNGNQQAEAASMLAYLRALGYVE